jgi:two-component system, OmpR family, response regulator
MDPHTLLIAAADPQLRELLATTLRAPWARLLLATDGITAERLARWHRANLAVLHANLPKRNGFATCRLLKSSRELAAINIVLLTTDITDLARGEAAGAHAVVVMPFSPHELREIVRTLLLGSESHE